MILSKSRFLCCFAFTLVAASNPTSSSTCNTLSSALPEIVSFPETKPYNASILSYPFLQLRLSPTCIVRPNTTQDVATIITILNQNNRTRFAIKGGGHNINAGFNNINDGVTIDMRSMKTVELARGNEVVRVGAGAIGQDVYDVVQKHNLTVLGPRIGVVGIAGFTTGGGINFLSPAKGWACDSVVNFQVVLSSGEIVNANASSRPDLYAALKGGQSNFGTVTRFDLKTYPQGPIWGGRIAYAANASTALLEAYTRFKNAEKYDPYAAGWVTIAYNHSKAQFTPVSILWYTEPQLKPGALQGIIDSGAHVMNGMIEAPINEHVRNASRGATAVARRVIWATTTFHISPTILHRIHTFWKTLIPSIAESHLTANVAAELTFQSLPPAPPSHFPSNSLGLENDPAYEKSLVFAQVIFMYDDNDDNDNSRATAGLEKALKDIVERIDELAEDEGVAHGFKYMNFAAWFQDPLVGYGRERKRALREVARKYDPQEMFQRQLSGGFKLY